MGKGIPVYYRNIGLVDDKGRIVAEQKEKFHIKNGSIVNTEEVTFEFKNDSEIIYGITAEGRVFKLLES